MFVEIFGWDPEQLICKPCLNAKKLVELRGMEHQFYPMAKMSVTEDHKVNKMELSNRAADLGFVVATLPQIFVDGKHIGGFDDFKEYVNAL